VRPFRALARLTRTRRLAAVVVVILATSATIAGATAVTIASGLLATSSKTLTHATCTLQGTAQSIDSEVRSASPTTNYGTQTTMVVEGTGSQRKVYVQFTLSACSPTLPSNAEVDSATLTLYATTVGGTRTLKLYRTTSTWTETGITWNTQPTSTPASPTTSFSVSATGNQTIDVSNDVNDFLQTSPSALPPYGAVVTNYGWMVDDEATGTTQITFASSENGTTTHQPKLVIAYAS
jgi:hypothetical protein